MGLNLSAPTPRPSILLIDDDRGLCETLAFALRKSYVVHTAPSGDEATRLLQGQPIRAIILDAFLGDERGLDLVPTFRALSAAPVVMLTGHTSEALLLGALQAKVDAYLKKPVSLPDLEATLSRLVPSPADAEALAARARRRLEEGAAKPFRPRDLAGSWESARPISADSSALPTARRRAAT